MRVLFVTTGRKVGSVETLARRGVEVVTLHQNFTLNGPLKLLSYLLTHSGATLEYAARVSFCLAKQEFDVLHVEPAFPTGFVAAITKSVKSSMRSVISLIGVDIGIVSEIGYGQRLDPWKNYLTRVALRSADLIISPSPLGASIAGRAGADPQKVKVIPWGVDTARHNPRVRENSVELRARLGLADHPVIMTVGRLHPVKGLWDLLYSMRIVLQTLPNARLVMVGKGELYETLLNLSASLRLTDSVIFTGYIPDDMLPPYYGMADVFCQPSHFDLSPIAALKAMACGTPVIVTDMVGTSYYVLKGNAGLVVKSRDHRALAAALIDLLTNRSKREEMAENASRIASSFNRDAIAQLHVEAYKTVLNH